MVFVLSRGSAVMAGLYCKHYPARKCGSTLNYIAGFVGTNWNFISRMHHLDIFPLVTGR